MFRDCLILITQASGRIGYAKRWLIKDVKWKQYQGWKMKSWKSNENSWLLLTTDDKELWVVTKYDGEEDRVVLLRYIRTYVPLHSGSSFARGDRPRTGLCQICGNASPLYYYTRKNQSAQPLTLPWHRCKQGSIRGTSHPEALSGFQNPDTKWGLLSSYVVHTSKFEVNY